MNKHIFFIAALLAAFVCRSQTTPLIPARANVAAYSNDDDIIKNAYQRSPYYFSLAGNWKNSATDSSVVFSRTIDVDKAWKDYTVCLNVRCGQACRLYVNGKEVAYATDSRQWNEFEINKFLKYGKSNTITIEALKHSAEASVEDPDIPVGLSGDPFILFKSNPGIADFTVVSTFDPNASTGTLFVACNTVCAKRKGKYYLEMEVLDPQGHRLDRMGRWVVFNGVSEEIVDISRSWAGISPWTAETPSLYTLILRLRDQDMLVEETVGAKVGFRTIAVDNRQLLVNGQPVTLKPVTYGTLNLSEKQMEDDIIQMKKNNINAVRTSKYSPLDPVFYQLSDKYGLYVIPDANLVPVSKRGFVAAVDKENIPLFEKRVENLYATLRNHPSVVAWSLGTCRDNGVCITAALNRLHQLDHNRPVVSQVSSSSDFDLPDSPSWPLDADSLANLCQIYVPVSVQLSKLTRDQAFFLVTNNNDFLPLSNYSLQYTIYSNLRNNIIAGDLAVSASPHGTDEVDMLLPPNLSPGEQLFVRFEVSASSKSALRHFVPQTVLSAPLKGHCGTPVQYKIGNDIPCSIAIDSTTATLTYTIGDRPAIQIPTPELENNVTPHILRITSRRVDSTTYSIHALIRYPNVCDISQTATLFSDSQLLLEYTIAPNPVIPYTAVKINLAADSLRYFGADRMSATCPDFRPYTIPLSNTAQSRDLTSWCCAYPGNIPVYIRQLHSDFAFSAKNDCITIIPSAFAEDNGTRSVRIILSPSLTQAVGTSFPSYGPEYLQAPNIASSSSRFSSPIPVSISGQVDKLTPRQSGKQKKTKTNNPIIRYTTDGTDPTPSSSPYTDQFIIDRTTLVKAAIFVDDTQKSFIASRQFNYDHISSVTFSRKPNTPYNKGTDTILFDGLRGTAENLARGWLGFSGNPPEVTVQLAEAVTVDNVLLRFAHSPATWAFAPSSVQIVVLDTAGEVLDSVSVAASFDPSSQDHTNPVVVEISAVVNRPNVKALRIIPAVIDHIPAWHRAKGLNPWLMMDEIIVNEKLKIDN